MSQGNLCLLGLGTNLPPRVQNLTVTFNLLSSHPSITVLATSLLYESAPMYVVNQPLFLNAVVLIQTLLSPIELLIEVKKIETTIGRPSQGELGYIRFGPRVIDVDLLFYDTVVVQSEVLTLPHPRLHEREFVLKPLANLMDKMYSRQSDYSTSQRDFGKLEIHQKNKGTEAAMTNVAYQSLVTTRPCGQGATLTSDLARLFAAVTSTLNRVTYATDTRTVAKAGAPYDIAIDGTSLGTVYPVLPLGPFTVLRIPEDRPLIMGIVNFDTGSLANRAITFAEATTMIDRLVEEGADMLDLGLVSSRPDKIESTVSAPPLSLLLTCISYIKRKYPYISISIDSSESDVISAALSAGAQIVNDITGGLKNPEIVNLLAKHCGTFIAMHVSDADDVHKPLVASSAVVDTVMSDLNNSLTEISKCLPDWAVVLDPGFGFGKSRAQNMALMQDFRKLVDSGYCVLGGVSRKRFTRGAHAAESAEALAGTSAVHLKLMEAGVGILRVHDVAAAKVVIEVATKPVKFSSRVKSRE
jgi:dihydropteroate synthase/2-amino-4-hydroxy-6-hydroxymethyldihydropteridine diphosphokinase